MRDIQINASLSCMDLLHIQDQMEILNKSSVDGYHYDVVDGEFNHCFIFGDLLLEKIRPLTKKQITVHLAVNSVEKYLEPMVRAGADYIAVHYETPCDHKEIFRRIRQLGAKPVLAFRCDSDVPDDFEELAAQSAWILKLLVKPGFAGQVLYKDALFHLKAMNIRLKRAGIQCKIEADGNVNPLTIPSIVDAGATILTGGTSGLFDPHYSVEENYKRMRGACE